MDLDRLRASPVGQLVPIEGTDEQHRTYSYFAFLPDNLPPSPDLDAVSWTSVAAATESLGKLHQACVQIPNTTLLIAPALAREAVDTSALEGTFGALHDVLEARLNKERPNSPEIREIRGYELMAYQAFDWVRERPITTNMLAALQGILAAESTTPPRDPGQVRKHQVVIGPRNSTVYESRYVPPPPDDRLKAGLDALEGWIQTTVLPAPLAAALAHYQFESLHPFGDGNGRVGRLAIVLQLMRSGSIPEPALTLSSWLLRRREEYQDHLLALSQTGDWNPWVRFFCMAICEQANSAVEVVGNLIKWMAKVRQILNERHWSGTVVQIAEDLINWPMITMPWTVTNYEVSMPTAKSAIDRLVDAGVLHEMTGKKYGRIFGAMEVIRAVELM